VEREMHELRVRLDAIETTQRCTVDTRDISEDESENEVGNKGEEVTVEDVADECLFRAVARVGAREKMDIPVYEGNLDVEELLDWIRALDKYFNYEDVEEEKKVKLLEYRRWCARFTIDDTLVTQPQAKASLRAP
jgi:hypothetical protein